MTGGPAFVLGPSVWTRRDPEKPLRWGGLSGHDVDVLQRFLGELGVRPLELHTGIPVGEIPVSGSLGYGSWMERMVTELFPRRVDAALRWPAGWWLIELKDQANFAGLGQCLCYYFLWCRDVGRCSVSRVLLVCDSCAVDLAEVCGCCGVDVVAVGDPGAVNQG